MFAIILLAAVWLFWGWAQTAHGVRFEWSAEHGFRSIDACPESSWISRVIEAPYCSLVALQTTRFIVEGFKQRGWTQARGTLAPRTIPYTPIVLGVYLNHFEVTDPTVTELMLASKRGDLNRVKQLLSLGAVPDARDQNGNTALIHACTNSQVSADLLEVLLLAGADVNAIDHSGATALHSATADGVRLTCVKQLLAHGANPNIQDKSGDTPLIAVVMHAHDEDEAIQAVRLLLSAGANPSTQNRAGETALSWAKQLGRDSVSHTLTETVPR